MSYYGDYEDQAFIAELYDLIPQYAGRLDYKFYTDLCRSSGGKVLELGCGTGRVLIRVAAAGCEIVGLDLSPFMLAKCRERLASQTEAVQNRVKLAQANMTDFDLQEKFSTIIIPFRPFQHLVSVRDQLACLRCANAHLPIGGKLAIDFFQVDFSKIKDPRRTEETEDVSELKMPDGRRLRRCSRIVATHRAEQYNDVELIYYLTDHSCETKRLVQSFPFRYFFRYEVEHLFARAGFEVTELYGNFDKTPLADDSPEMIFVGNKVADPS